MRLRFTLCTLLAVCAASLPLEGQSGAADSGWSGAAADTRARALADSLRRQLLSYATFAGFGDTTCTNADVRTFERDSTGVTRKLLAQLESLVMSYGAFESLDNPPGKALLRTVVRLEAGGPGPRWDTMSGAGVRAFNPILPVRMLNTDTKECVMTPGTVPDGLALPLVADFTAPRDSGAFEVDVAFGPQALNTLRNRFFARHTGDTTSVMHHARVNAHAIWTDYAVVGVTRQRELKGVVALPKENTGSVYAFHRVGDEWRVLALIRTW